MDHIVFQIACSWSSQIFLLINIVMSFAKYLRIWAVEWDCSAELIKYALEKNRKILSDTNKMLKKFVQSGIKKPEEALERERKSLPKEVKKTYETEEIGKNSVLDWIKKYANEEET